MSIKVTDRFEQYFLLLDRKTKQSLTSVGQDILTEAKQRVRVDTGRLKNSLVIEQTKDKLGRNVLKVGSPRTASSGSFGPNNDNAFYAARQDRAITGSTPYLTPAGIIGFDKLKKILK